jgi:hypothetical protein
MAGGWTRDGAVQDQIDESIRHAVTKFAHVHFPASQEAAVRIERMLLPWNRRDDAGHVANRVEGKALQRAADLQADVPVAPAGVVDSRKRRDRYIADGDAIASRLMRYRDQNGQDWADIIDMLTLRWPPEAVV